MTKRALEGIKVADFTWAVAGPITTKYLADYGATVVRIESQNHPCFLRTSGPYKDSKPGPDTTGYFAFFNPNKYGVVLELDNPKGVEVARRLIAWADIVVENFTPGVMDNLGLGYTELKKLRPDIIMLSSSGQGQTGPFARVPIGGNWLVALTGFSWLTGWPDDEPIQPFGAYNDFIAPRYGIVSILAALRYRRRTGKGQYIDLSQLEAGIQFFAPPLMDFAANGNEGTRMGNASLCAAPHGVYPCREGRWCAIAVRDDNDWAAFRHVLGDPPWAEGEPFATLLGRKRNEPEVNRRVGEWTAGFTPEEVMARLQEAGVPAGVVQSARDLHEDPQLKARHHFWTLEHRAIGSYDHLGEAAILSKTPAEKRMPAPCLGEHTEYVCHQFLNMSDGEFVDFLNAGAFGSQ